ncbi:hypothetical protein A176_004713 [Myxococcus hansupus]|uniref:Lipoprotein n=1 Tax=Pseudomyxococcus hansupus TaxID=1297742 RepID=A0A0H4WWM2_9BACT|nr:hypothetical protein [Myxococcus hansupus]AKQ67801.1 hypothetical protein A176_004713 [Myxococcus hansupus]
MHRFRPTPALFAAMALLGCQSGQDSKTPAPPPAATAPTPQAPAPAKAEPPAPPPPAAELGYLKPTEDAEHCEWMRQPLPGTATRVFRFEAACDRSQVSWSADGKQGLLFTWPSGEGEVPRAWQVDATTKSGQPIDLKTLPGGTSAGNENEPYVSRLGFDAEGRPVALVFVAFQPKAAQKNTVTFEGESFPVPPGKGVPGLAMAYRREDGGWKRIEAKGSRVQESTPSDQGLLDVEATLTPAYTASPPSQVLGTRVPAATAKTLNAQVQGASADTRWMELPGPGGTLYYPARQAGPLLAMGQPLIWARGDQRVFLKDLAEPDAYLSFQFGRGLLLVTSYGGYAAANVWNPETQQRVASIPEAYAPAFWPTP